MVFKSIVNGAGMDHKLSWFSLRAVVCFACRCHIMLSSSLGILIKSPIQDALKWCVLASPTRPSLQ